MSRETDSFLADHADHSAKVTIYNTGPFIPDVIGIIVSFLPRSERVSFALAAKFYYIYTSIAFNQLPLEKQYTIFQKISRSWRDLIPARASQFFFFYFKNPLRTLTYEQHMVLQALVVEDNTVDRNELSDLRDVLNANINALNHLKPRSFLKCWPDPFFNVELAQCAGILLAGFLLCAGIVIPVFILLNRRYADALTSKSGNAMIGVFHHDFRTGDLTTAYNTNCDTALFGGNFSALMTQARMGDYINATLRACLNFMATCLCSQTFNKNHTMMVDNGCFQVQVGCPTACSSINEIRMQMLVASLILNAVLMPLLLMYFCYVFYHLFVDRDAKMSNHIFQEPSLPTCARVKTQMNMCCHFFKKVLVKASAHPHTPTQSIHDRAENISPT